MRRGSYDDAAASIRPHLQNLAQRRRSAPSLVFGRALGKTWIPIREEGLCQVEVDQCPFVLGLTNEDAELAMDESVQLTEGLKTRERHLFLFSDILVIAKLKASSSYRLKHKVNLEQLWLVTFEEEEEDVGINLKTSLFMAWPLAHCVVSFRSPEVKERWLDTLHRKIKEATERSGSQSPPPSILMTVLSGSITCKTLPGGGMDSVIEPLSDGSTTPPTQAEQLYNAVERACQPIENSSTGKFSMLARKLRKSTTSQSNPSSSKTPLFGQQLSKVCPENEKLPKPIMEMLTLLLKKGTFTEGVFRKAGNARNLREVRDDLNNGKDVDMGSKPVLLLAALLKDFLRQLPGSLLVADQYKDWTTALERKDIQERYAELKQVLDKLPRVNVVLLQHLLCLLHHISQNVSTNKMDAKNLAICFAPTLLHCDPLKDEKGKLDKVTNLTLFLIENCCEIFGEQVQTLLGEPDEEELVDNSDSLSSHQHDSAYDSTDPDADGEMGGPSGVMEDNPRSCCRKNQTPPIPSCSSSAIFNAFTRRRSEPTIFPSARSCDDFALSRLRFQEQPLKKQVSDDSVLMSGWGERTGALPPLTGNWTTTTTASAVDLKGGSCSSSCSLESSFSNQSESSVFTSSPLASPSGCRRSLMPHHPSFSTSKSGEEPPTPAPTPLPSQQLDKEVKEVKRRAQSMRNDGRNLHQRRARSWSNVLSRGGSLKKGDPQKEGAPFPCETLREDSLSEAEPVNPLIPRRRPLSAVEVFQQVDSRIPSRPPSYELALLSGAQPAPPQYPLTVKDARELERKSRPSSVSEESLLHTCPNQALMDCHFQHMPATVPSGLAMPIPDSAPLAFRQRAMSESVSRVQQEKLTRRCSQPLFEEISYAKESYV